MSVNNIVKTDDIYYLIDQLNNINNEMSQDLSILKNKLAAKDVENKELKQALESLSVRIGDLSRRRDSGSSTHRRVSGKSYKFGITDETLVDISTLIKDTSGNLVWVDDSGVQTILA